MISIEVDGHVLPAPLAGHPVLEFCNTWAGWNSPPGAGGDYLTSADVLTTLLGHHGLLTPGQVAAVREATQDDEHGAALLQQARQLRGVVYLLLTGAGGEREHRLFATWAEEARAAQRWERHEDGSHGWVVRPRHAERLPLLVVAEAAARLLTDGPAGATRACPGRDCGWLFLDPRGRRRWCSMAVCGNRAKARGHAERTRS